MDMQIPTLPAHVRPNSSSPRRLLISALLIISLALYGAALAQDQQAQDEQEAQGEQAPAGDQRQVAVLDADPVVIRVGDTVERLSDIEWRFEIALRSFAAGQGMAYSEEIAAQMRPMLPSYLEQRGTELVLLREASNRGFEADQESVATSLERIRASVQEGDDYESMLANAGFGSEAMLITLIEEGDLISQVIEDFNQEAVPSEEELRVRYLADRELFTEPESYCARHILVDDEAVAGDLVARVAAGEDFGQLASEFGTDGTASSGGDLGCFGRGAMVAEFENAVLEAEIGEVTGPVQTQFGYHALLVYDHNEASVAAFDEVKAELQESVAAETANARLGGLIRGAGVITYPELVPGL